MESVSTSLDSCGVFAYGGVKDFTVTIVENSNVTTTTTTPTDEYCVAGPTSPLDSNLGRVHLDGFSSSIDNAVDCPGQTSTQLYLDEEADLVVGQSYSLVYDVTTCGSEYSRASQAWIDWQGIHKCACATHVIMFGIQALVSLPRVMLLEQLSRATRVRPFR
jgi:hypothetical protein